MIVCLELFSFLIFSKTKIILKIKFSNPENFQNFEKKSNNIKLNAVAVYKTGSKFEV